ncbi:hypothetical protein ACFYKX_04650 [Cytobacillus sp. FJAT-54145]|uniref:Uncharacterized protein n=1 Tax=Cytobacillus spartinae TaxID=3299023 RepID=A0ABW6K845_9BACI
MKNKTEEDDKGESGSERFWDLFLTGGWSSFENEWKSSKSSLHTILMFLVPIFTAGIIILLAIVANKIFN